MPAPALYLLPDERGINAFAAGQTPADAVVAVTRGTLLQLKRDELQGVIGHELAHIAHGHTKTLRNLVSTFIKPLAKLVIVCHNNAANKIAVTVDVLR